MHLLSSPHGDLKIFARHSALSPGGNFLGSMEGEEEVTGSFAHGMEGIFSNAPRGQKHHDG